MGFLHHIFCSDGVSTLLDGELNIADVFIRIVQVLLRFFKHDLVELQGDGVAVDHLKCMIFLECRYNTITASSLQKEVCLQTTAW